MICTQRRMRLCITLLVCNLIFIWGNSLLPGEISGALSGFVKDVIRWLLGRKETGDSAGHGLLRKLMHLTEFLCLGMCLRWLFGMRLRKPVLHWTLPLGAGLLAALVDEGIQLFVPDRGPSFYDVGIDFTGVTLGVVIISLIQILKKIKLLKENTT